MIVRTIPYKVRSMFERFHARTEAEAILICHRRAGKTVAICNDAQRKALTLDTSSRPHNPGRFAWFYPTRVRAKDIAWTYLKYYASFVEGARPIESELAVEYPNKARVTLYGADNSRGVGLWLDGVYYDERDDIPDKTIQEVAPTLMDWNGFSVQAGMLRGRYRLWKEHEKARGDDSIYKLLMKASLSGVYSPDQLAKLKGRMGASAYDMQMECNPNAAIANAIYGREMDEMRQQNRICKLTVDRASPLYAFADIGHSLQGDDWSWWFIQFVGRDVLCHRYYARTGELPVHYANKIFAVEQELGARVAMVYLPHDGTRQDRHGVSTKDDLEAAGLVGRVRTVIRTPRVWDSINDVRALLPRVWIDAEGCGEAWSPPGLEDDTVDHCPSGIDCLDYYTKKIIVQTGAMSEIPNHDQYSHGADAFRTWVEAYQNHQIDGVSDYAAQGKDITVNRQPVAQRRKILVNRYR